MFGYNKGSATYVDVVADGHTPGGINVGGGIGIGHNSGTHSWDNALLIGGDIGAATAQIGKDGSAWFSNNVEIDGIIDLYGLLRTFVPAEHHDVLLILPSTAGSPALTIRAPVGWNDPVLDARRTITGGNLGLIVNSNGSSTIMSDGTGTIFTLLTHVGTTEAEVLKVGALGGIGEFGSPPPASRPVISGVLTGATLAQLTSVVSQILVALAAKGTVSNATT